LLAVRLDNMGDVVMLGPALRSLKAALPSCRVTLLASPAGARAASLLPSVDEVLEWRALWQEVGDRGFDAASEWRLVHRLAAGAYDAALLFTSFSQSPYPPGVVALLAGIPVRAGSSKERGDGILTHWVPPGPDALHQVERNLRLVEQLGVPRAGEDLALRVPPSARLEADRLLAEAGLHDRRYLVAAPWASAPARTYDLDRFVEACALVAGATGCAVILTGGERDRQRAGVLADRIRPRALDLVGATSIPVLAALVARAHLVLTNNSLPLHLADACRTPVVVLYSGTDLESQWTARRSPARLLRRLTWCTPCYQMVCPFELECLDVSPQEVAAACVALLEGGRPATGKTEPDPGC
jgi:ADP-heptose:LPS heptosyltransferase